MTQGALSLPDKAKPRRCDRAEHLERKARAISDRLAGGERFIDVRDDIRSAAEQFAKPGYTLVVDAYSALLRSPTGRSSIWLWNDRTIRDRDRRAAQYRRELIEDCFCAVLYAGWDSRHGSPLHAHSGHAHGSQDSWPQTWREAETYLRTVDLADTRAPAIELVETWWSRTFDDGSPIPGGRGVDDVAGEPMSLAEYMRARDDVRGKTPEQCATLATARYLAESAAREGLRQLIAR